MIRICRHRFSAPREHAGTRRTRHRGTRRRGRRRRTGAGSPARRRRPLRLAASGPSGPGTIFPTTSSPGTRGSVEVAVPVADDLEVGAAEAGHAHAIRASPGPGSGTGTSTSSKPPTSRIEHCLHTRRLPVAKTTRPGPTASVGPGPPVFEATARVAAIPFTTRDVSTHSSEAGLLASGSSSGRAFPPASRQWLLASVVPGHSGGSAPVLHRLPSRGPHGHLQAPGMVDDVTGGGQAPVQPRGRRSTCRPGVPCTADPSRWG